MTKGLTPNFWRKYFKYYDVLNYLESYKELLDEILNQLNPREGELILDAGVGTGNLAILIERSGAKVIGLDFSPEALEIYRSKNPNAEVILHNLETPLPFKDNYFDKIVSNNTLYNIPRNKRQEVFNELFRVLKPGGLIVISNIHKDFKPLKIYLDGINKSFRKNGLIKTILLMIKLIEPTLKMFYYNRIIQKTHKLDNQNLFDFNEQRELLSKAGFINISENKMVYSDQGILNIAYKP
ncbi:MAG: methyltransferase domain-containing protein [Patescibacteria group bacterium]|nr:methyltransferase domain-containing protein [Patescibacteria group bacterium]